MIAEPDPAVIPRELVTRRQWVAWRYEDDGRKGKRAKVPYTPGVMRRASTTKSEDWGTFDDAQVTAHAMGLDGIGYVFSADGPYCGIDLDGCRNPDTGELATWAQDIVERFKTYTEVSPSGTGVKLWLSGRKPEGRNKVTLGEGVAIEVYDRRRFFTLTGEAVAGTSSAIEERQGVLDDWYAATFGAQCEADPTSLASGEEAPARQGSSTGLSDDTVIERASQGAKGERFRRLWAGDASKNRDDESAADIALCGILAFYTGNNAEQMDRLFRRSGRYRDKWERADYRQPTLEKAIRNNTSVFSATGGQPHQAHQASQPQQPEQAQRVQHVYDWQRRIETPQQRNRLLAQAADEAKERVRQHFASVATTYKSLPLLIALPPGVGKSHAIADLGKDFNVAWISERHDMRESVPALMAFYRAIHGCKEDNCSEYRKHAALVAKGRNTWPLHKYHTCGYYQQHEEEGSAVYQIAHVQTSYPQRHMAIVTDELNLSSWLPERAIGHNAIQSVLASPQMAWNTDVVRLMRGLREVLTLAQRDAVTLHGRALFEALDHELGGELAELVEGLSRTDAWMETRPKEPVRLSLAEIEALPPVVVPYVLRALHAELSQWRAGGDWNSRTRVSRGEHGWALYTIEPRHFTTPEEAATIPWAILDATANEEFLERLLGTPVTLVRREVEPPPHMRHIAVRTGKRYGKVSLVEAKHSDEDQMRVVRELRYLLKELGVTEAACRAGEVGLITFKGVEALLGEALCIPSERRGHFWGMRGSNALADCRVLLVVGTPTPNLSALVSWTRALYHDAPAPIDTETVTDEQGRRRYRDMRLRRLADYMTNAELTQCAHRNRPLRFDGRVVVTLCQGEIDFLPITETYQSFPRLNEDGTLYAETKRQQDENRLSTAYNQWMEREGNQRGQTDKAGKANHARTITVRALRDELRAVYGVGLASSTVSAWLRTRRAGPSTACVTGSP